MHDRLRRDAGAREEGVVSVSRRRLIWLDQQKHCCWCGRLIDFSFASLEHLVPQVHGGTDAWTNLAVACKDCNSSRGDSMGCRRFPRFRLDELLAAARRRAKERIERPPELPAWIVKRGDAYVETYSIQPGKPPRIEMRGMVRHWIAGQPARVYTFWTLNIEMAFRMTERKAQRVALASGGETLFVHRALAQRESA